mgnify:CR=1 FL=1
MGLVRIRKFSYTLSGLFVLASVISLWAYGLRLGIDFTGGSLLEINYSSARPEIALVSARLEALNLGQIILQPLGERGFSMRSRELSGPEADQVLATFSQLGDIQDSNSYTLSSSLGREVAIRSLWAIALVLLAIVFYIAWAFRKVSIPVSSWFYGLFAVVALFHDIFIPLGVFSLLGKFKGVEVDTLFVTALLTVLGFSVHDTIVVFDRVRENLKNQIKNESFEETVDRSLWQTLVRSINTSLTVLIVLVSLYLFGAESTRYFSLALIIGIIAGTYSSIFIASPLLVTWNNFRRSKS